MTTQDLGRTSAAMEISDRFEEARIALRAFAVMLGSTLDDHSSAHHISEGICTLLHQQVDHLQGIDADFAALIHDYEACLASAAVTDNQLADPSGMTPEDRIAEIMRRSALADAGRPAWHDLDTIAVRSRVHRSEVARVMFVLTGEDHDGPAYRAWDGNLSDGLPAHLLTGLCWDALSRCDMFGKVSDATGLDLEKLREVLQALLTYSPQRERISPEPFADVLAVQAAEAAMRERVAAQDAKDEAPQPRPADLRNRMIVEQINEGVETSTIAQALNMRRSAVEKVVAQLQAQDHPTARAVNS